MSIVHKQTQAKNDVSQDSCLGAVTKILKFHKLDVDNLAAVQLPQEPCQLANALPKMML